MSTDDLLSSLESIQDPPAPVNVDGTTSTNSSFTPVPSSPKQRFHLPQLPVLHSKLALKILPLVLLLIGATVGSVMVRKQGFGDIRQRAYGGQACITSADCSVSGETCSNGTCVAGIADASPSTSPAPSPSTDPCTLYDPDTAQCISHEATPVPSPPVSPSPSPSTSPTPDTRPCTLADPETTECLSHEPVPASPAPSPSNENAPSAQASSSESPAQQPCTLYDPDTAQCISYEVVATPVPTPVSTPKQGSSKLASPVKFSTQNRGPCLQEDPATGTCLEYGPVPDSTEVPEPTATPEPTPRATTTPIAVVECTGGFLGFGKTCEPTNRITCPGDNNGSELNKDLFACDEHGKAFLLPPKVTKPLEVWCSGILSCEFGCIPTEGGGYCANGVTAGTQPTLTVPTRTGERGLGVTGVSDGTVGFGRNSSAYASGSVFGTVQDDICYDTNTGALDQSCVTAISAPIAIGAAASVTALGYGVSQYNPALGQKMLETSGNLLQVGSLAYGIKACNDDPNSETCQNIRMGFMADPVGSAQAIDQAIMGLSNDAALAGKYAASRFASSRAQSALPASNPFAEMSPLVLPDTHGMSPAAIDDFLTQGNVLNAQGEVTGRKLIVMGDTMGKRVMINGVSESGYATFNKVQGLSAELGDDIVISNLAGNWEARNALAMNLQQRAEQGDAAAEELLNGFLKGKLKTETVADVQELVANKAQVAQNYQSMDLCSLNGSCFIQHTDNPELARLALSPSQMAQLKQQNPTLYGQIETNMWATADTLQGSGLANTLSASELKNIKQAAQELGIQPAEMVANINSSGRQVMLDAINNPTAETAASASKFYAQIMDPDTSFYQAAGGKQQAEAFADLFNVDKIAHGHTPWDQMTMPRYKPGTKILDPEKVLVTNQSNSYEGVVNYGGVTLQNFDINLSPGMRVYGVTNAEGVGVATQNFIQVVPQGAAPKVLNQTGLEFVLGGIMR